MRRKRGWKGAACAFLSAVMTLLSGCLPGAGNKPPKTTEITTFRFRHSGMWPGDCYCYTLERTQQGARLYMEELLSNGQIVDVTIEDPVMERIEQLTQQHELYRWNGFDKVDRHALDGTAFSLSIDFADGSHVHAHGSNKFPDGYKEAKQAIYELFAELAAQYDKPEQQTGNTTDS